MHRARALEDQKNIKNIKRTTVHDHEPYTFGTKLQLRKDKIDILAGEKIDIAKMPKPETLTQAQIQAL
jgi:hypothetical protein